MIDRDCLSIRWANRGQQIYSHNNNAIQHAVGFLEDIGRDMSQVINLNPQCKIDGAKTLIPSFNINQLSDNQYYVYGDKLGMLYHNIVCMMFMHLLDDIPSFLRMISNSLMPDGVFVCNFFGPLTLHELKTSLIMGEAQDGCIHSPHIMPMKTHVELSRIFSMAGFSNIVITSEILKFSYSNIYELCHNIRIGMGNVLDIRDKKYIGKELFENANIAYQANFSHHNSIQATIEILYCTCSI